MTALTFRRARTADSACIARLHALCFERSWDRAFFVRLLARPGALGLLACRPEATDTVHACGFALFEQVAEQAEILTLGVDPGCRGRGAGTGLLARGLEELALRGVRRVSLEVAVDNAPALALYRSAGFVHTGCRPAYYQRGPGRPPADGLIFTCRIEPFPGR